MQLPGWIRAWIARDAAPRHLARGRLGEAAARRHLRATGMKFLAANFAGRRGEIDLVFRDGACLVFVEVKARAAGGWTRPASAVDFRKQRRLSATALEYLAATGNPRVAFRFDIVEVLLEGDAVAEVRHLRNAFPLDPRRMYA